MKLRNSTLTITFSFLLILLISSCSKPEMEMAACNTEFSGEVTSCSSNRQVVYKFITGTEEKSIRFEGSLNNFVGPEAVITVTGATLDVSQVTSSEANTRGIKIEGTISPCQQVVITITWSSTNYDDIISSDWTVKNAEGVELAPAVPALACDPR